MTKSPEVEYWASYYQTGQAPTEPSKFAAYISEKYLQNTGQLIELGCGNGRDARYFASLGLGVVAVDICSPEIEVLSDSNTRDNLKFEAGDFTRLPESNSRYDYVYSRFTLHSVDAEGQKRAIEWSSRSLKEGGLLCVETRGQKNELYRMGKPVEGEPNAFIYEDHYRRFEDFEVLQQQIESSGLKILEAAEDKGFAPFGDTDYHFVRVIAQK